MPTKSITSPAKAQAGSCSPNLQKKEQAIYRASGCAPNTGKVIERANEKERAPNRRVTGAEQEKRGGTRSSGSRKNFREKIQAIYNGKCAPITMQGFAQAWENPSAQEQWKTMEKNNARSNRNNRNMARHAPPARVGLGDLRAHCLVSVKKSPPSCRAGDNSHKSETRISAIADFATGCKRKKKALPLFPPWPTKPAPCCAATAQLCTTWIPVVARLARAVAIGCHASVPVPLSQHRISSPRLGPGGQIRSRRRGHHSDLHCMRPDAPRQSQIRRDAEGQGIGGETGMARRTRRRARAG